MLFRSEFVSHGISPAEEQDTWDQKKHLLEHPQVGKDGRISRFDAFRARFMRSLEHLFPFQRSIAIVYILATTVLAGVLIVNIGHDVLPKVNGDQFQLRLRAADGTRFERTEEKTIQALKVLDDLIGKENIRITSAFVGQHPAQFSTSPIYLFMSGPQEAVIQVALKEGHKEKLDMLKERIRDRMRQEMPDVRLSFEPIELTDKVLSQGSPTPVEVRIAGKDKKWVWANAVIVGDTVVCTHPDVPNPVAVRYAFTMNPVGANLYNRDGLPASPFRTDDW